MGVSTKKVHNKSEDKGIAYILAAKREAERSKQRWRAGGVIVYKCVACGKEFKRNTKQHTKLTGHETFQLVVRRG